MIFNRIICAVLKFFYILYFNHILVASKNNGKGKITTKIDLDEFYTIERPLCGSTEPENLSEYIRSTKHFKAFEKQARTSNSRTRTNGSVIIPVQFHIITSSSGQGYVSDEQLDDQIKVINDAFSGKDTLSCKGYENVALEHRTDTPFRFLKIGVNRVTNNDWFVSNFYNDGHMKRELHVGGCETLNVYTTHGGGLLGWAKFPQDCAEKNTNDGVVIRYSTVPGLNGGNFGLGDTLTHEIGHWLGLFHTFQGGCEVGDGVNDTPAQGTSSFGCVLDKDTCPNKPGLDPVFNFMDYSNDCCMYKFTPQQTIQMDFMHQQYRQSRDIHTLVPTFKENCSKKHNIKVAIVADRFSEETSWKITKSTGEIMASGGGKQSEIFESCFPDDCYTFTVEDSAGDGMCCGFGKGSYELYWKNKIVGSGGEFKRSESMRFGCPLPISCDSKCRTNEVISRMTLQRSCMKRKCRKCNKCKSLDFSCNPACHDRRKRLGNMSWNKKCTNSKCAGCSLC